MSPKGSRKNQKSAQKENYRNQSEDGHPTFLVMLKGLAELAGAAVLFATIIKFAPIHPNTTSLILLWAIGCAAVSGTIWAALVRLKHVVPLLREGTTHFGELEEEKENSAFGHGDTGEPIGVLEPIIWAFVVFGPLTVSGWLLRDPQASNIPAYGYWGFLLGAALGSLLFYGGKLRLRLFKPRATYTFNETRIVWAWTSVIAFWAFFGYEISHAVSNGVALGEEALRIVVRLAIVVLGVSLPITAFVTLIPGTRHANVRGLLGGFLMVWMSLQALLVTRTDGLSDFLWKLFDTAN